MPTATKLIAALVFGAMGVAMAWLFGPSLEGVDARRPWLAICGAIGFWAGWWIAGRGAGQGIGPAIGIGLTASAALAFVSLFVMAFWRMGTRAMRGGYDDPVTAVVSVFQYIAEYAVQLGSLQIGAVLLVGGVLGGILCEIVARRSR